MPGRRFAKQHEDVLVAEYNRRNWRGGLDGRTSVPRPVIEPMQVFQVDPAASIPASVVVQPTGETHLSIYGPPGTFTDIVTVGDAPAAYTDGASGTYMRVSSANNYVPEVYGRFPATDIPSGWSSKFTAIIRQHDESVLTYAGGLLAPVPWTTSTVVLGYVASLEWPLTATPEAYANLQFDGSVITTDFQTITGSIAPRSGYTASDVESLIASGDAWWVWWVEEGGYDAEGYPLELSIDLADIRLIWEPVV